MLAAGAAETLQRVAGDVVAAGDRDLLDGIGHIVDGDANEALGHGARIHARAPGNLLATGERGGGIDRLVAIGAEDVREMLGADLAEHDIAVGHRQRPAAPIAGRARHRAGAVRPDPEPAAVIMADRSAAGRDRVDFEHRRANPDAGDRTLAGPLIASGEMGDVRRGAAHVEPDQALLARLGAGPRHADDAAGGPRQDRVLAAEGRGVGQAAIRLHEEETRASSRRPAQSGHDLVDIATQHRRQIGVDQCGVARGRSA